MNTEQKPNQFNNKPLISNIVAISSCVDSLRRAVSVTSLHRETNKLRERFVSYFT